LSARVVEEQDAKLTRIHQKYIWSLTVDKMSSQTMMVMLGSMLAMSKVLEDDEWNWRREG
jgi:hypothetical protein